MNALPCPPNASRPFRNRPRDGEQPDDQAGNRAGAQAKARRLSVRELKALLQEFEATLPFTESEPELIQQYKRVLDEFAKIRARWEKRQVRVAEGFNVLRTMRLTSKELCHSDILAWLLDHRLDVFGTHGQGNLGFQLFLEKLRLPVQFADADYRVKREVSGQASRLDIVVEADRKFIIGIENKITSEEMMGFGDTEDQTLREWKDLRDRAGKLHVKLSKIEAFFLTPDNQPPRSDNFKPMSWGLVAGVFEEFAAKAKPPMVRLFAQHYAETLHRYVVSEAETQQEGKEYAEAD